MHQSQEEQTERLLAMGLGVGAAVAIGGFVLFFLGFVLGAVVMGFGGFLMFCGLISVGTSLYVGMNRNKTAHEGPPVVYGDAKVVTRAAYDSRAQLVFSDDDLMQDDVRYYVKLELEKGNRIEFECARETYYSAGEGSRGTATVQGKWLSQFVVTIGPH